MQRLQTLLRLVAILSTVAVCVSLPACQPVDPPMLQPVAGQQLTQLAEDTAHGPPAGARPFCRALRWFTTCSIPEISDDARLRVAGREYGPYVWVVPAEDLQYRSHVLHFTAPNNGGVLAGGVWVDTGPGPLPAEYVRLRLSRGWNCVYLRGGGTWAAFVTAAVSGSAPCPATNQTTNPLEVTRTVAAGFAAFSDVLPVARFHESGVTPFFGMKCGNAWCFIGVPAVGLVPPVPHQAVASGRIDWVVPGRYDAQDLAIRGVAQLVPSGLNASIIPGPGASLRGESRFAQRQHAATVFFNDTPRGKYAATAPGWGFQRGENKLLLQLEGGNWLAWIENPGGQLHRVRVRRFDHGMYPPPTARFRWDDQDDNVWVACDDGCCYVSDT